MGYLTWVHWIFIIAFAAVIAPFNPLGSLVVIGLCIWMNEEG